MQASDRARSGRRSRLAVASRGPQLGPALRLALDARRDTSPLLLSSRSGRGRIKLVAGELASPFNSCGDGCGRLFRERLHKSARSGLGRRPVGGRAIVGGCERCSGLARATERRRSGRRSSLAIVWLDGSLGLLTGLDRHRSCGRLYSGAAVWQEVLVGQVDLGARIMRVERGSARNQRDRSKMTVREWARGRARTSAKTVHGRLNYAGRVVGKVGARPEVACGQGCGRATGSGQMMQLVGVLADGLRSGQVLHRHYAASLLGQLGARLGMRVEHRKIGYDNWHYSDGIGWDRLLEGLRCGPD